MSRRSCRIVPTTSCPSSIARDELGDLLGRVLEIGVEREDVFAVRRREAGEDGHVLPRVPHELDHLHDAGILRRRLLEDLERTVARAVVREDDLVRAAEARERRTGGAGEGAGRFASSLKTGTTTETFRGTTARSSLRFTGAILAGRTGRPASVPMRELAEPAADDRLVRVHGERAFEVIARSCEVPEAPGRERHQVQRLRVAGIPRREVPEERLRRFAFLRLEEGLAQRGAVPEVSGKASTALRRNFTS